MKVSKPRIETAIALHFAPVLRADGFKGSGRTFRRITGLWIQVLNVQGSRWGGEFCVNLAIHPFGVPVYDGRVPDPKKITQDLCCFRRRLTNTPECVDQWWAHDYTLEGMNRAVNQAAESYKTVGAKLFELAIADESILHRITYHEFSQYEISPDWIWCRDRTTSAALAWLRKESGRLDEARAFAAFALKHSKRFDTVFVDWTNSLISDIDKQILRQSNQME